MGCDKMMVIFPYRHTHKRVLHGFKGLTYSRKPTGRLCLKTRLTCRPAPEPTAPREGSLLYPLSSDPPPKCPEQRMA